MLSIENLTKKSFSKAKLSPVIIFLIFLSLGFVFLLSITWQRQVWGVDAARLAVSNTQWQQAQLPARGVFYASEGEQLVSNIPYYLVIFDNKYHSSDLSANLADASCSEQECTTWLTQTELLQLETELREIEASINLRQVRNYRNPEAYAHILGYTSGATAEDVEIGVDPQQRVGRTKLEAKLDEKLRGYQGVSSESDQQAAIAGNSFTLTIDATWQESLYKLVNEKVNASGARGGAAAIIEVDSGKVRAHISAPGFDTNQFELGISEADYTRLLENRRAPLTDKLMQQTAAPGSTFKLVSSYAALAAGIVNSNTQYFSNRCMQLGSTDFCEYGQFYLGYVNLESALAKSSNIYFCRSLLQLMSEDKFSFWQVAYENFGLTETVVTDLGTTANANIPTPSYKERVYGERWFAGDTCNTAIGQGEVSLTPLHMLQVAAAIGNDGKVYQPQYLLQRLSNEGIVLEEYQSKPLLDRDLDASFLQQIRNGMRAAATTGTVRLLGALPLNFMAKTGSAETSYLDNGQQKDGVHGWNVGTFDYQGKRYAYVVFLDLGGTSRVATEVIYDFGQCLLNNFRGNCH